MIKWAIGNQRRLFQFFAAMSHDCQDFIWFWKKIVPHKGSIHFNGKVSAQKCQGAGEDGY